MYKLTRPDGFDFYSGTVNYRDAIGTIIKVTDYDPPERGPCGRGLYASKTPNDCFVGAKIPCAAFRVRGIQPIAKDRKKTRYQALKVIEEITDLDKLFRWKYSEAINPIHPFKIEPPVITEQHIKLVKEWDSVRASVGDSVGAYIGSLFSNIKIWKYTLKTEEYPYKNTVDLWKQGLVPSFDGKTWRIHGKPNGKILWEEIF